MPATTLALTRTQRLSAQFFVSIFHPAAECRQICNTLTDSYNLILLIHSGVRIHDTLYDFCLSVCYLYVFLHATLPRTPNYSPKQVHG